MATKTKSKSKSKPKSKPAAKKPAKKVTKPAKKAKKVVAKPAKKKSVPKKPVKKVAKKSPPAKKKAVKAKPSAKKKVLVKAKKGAKSKPAPKKKVIKKVVKKAAKPTKKTIKKAVKKLVKKVSKVAAKKVVKKAKPVKKSAPAKKIKPVKKVALVKPVKTAKPAKAQQPLIKPGKSPKSEAMVVEKVKAGRRKSKKKGGDDDEPRIDELDPLVEELISVKKKGKQPKAPKIPSPIKLMPTVKIEAAVKEHIIPKNFRSGGKEKFEMEFFIKSSPRILYNFISSPSGLSEWFSDDVNIKNGIYTFFWEDSSEQAKLLATREFELMRFKWLNKDEDDTYFEMRIKIDELTGDVALIITDFAKKEELNESQMLWEAQIHDLCKALGS